MSVRCPRMLVWFAFLGLPVVSCGAESVGQPGQQVAVQQEGLLPHWLYLPADYAAQEQWPVLLFLHGAGERGSDLDKVKTHGPPKLIASGKSFPMIVVSPQCASGKRWEAESLDALLQHVQSTCKVDADRVYVSGLSMGGFGTWLLAASYPDRFAAIAPICGGGDPTTAAKFAHLPVWVFHGAQDKAVPLARSEEMVAALKAAGAAPKFTVYPEAGHDSWTASYDNPELYDWLLSHRRPPRK